MVVLTRRVVCWECGTPMNPDMWHARLLGSSGNKIPGYGRAIADGDVICKRCHVIWTRTGVQDQKRHNEPGKPCRLCTPGSYTA